MAKKPRKYLHTYLLTGLYMMGQINYNLKLWPFCLVFLRICILSYIQPCTYLFIYVYKTSVDFTFLGALGEVDFWHL